MVFTDSLIDITVIRLIPITVTAQLVTLIITNSSSQNLWIFYPVDICRSMLMIFSSVTWKEIAYIQLHPSFRVFVLHLPTSHKNDNGTKNNLHVVLTHRNILFRMWNTVFLIHKKLEGIVRINLNSINIRSHKCWPKIWEKFCRWQHPSISST
jgi:hypothetical protein